MTLKTGDLFRIFDRVWSDHYGVSYIGFGPKLGRVANVLIKAWPEITTEEFSAVCERYLADTDEYLRTRRHPFEVLCASSRINQYRVADTVDFYQREGEDFLRQVKRS